MQPMALVTNLLVSLILAASPIWAAAQGVFPEPRAQWPLTLKWQRCPGWYCETGWYASPAVADVDGDGQVEVLWGGYTLMAVNGADGSIKWIRPQGSSSRLWPGIVAADLDHNGTPEIVTASGNGQLTVYGSGLTPVDGWPISPTGGGQEIRSLAVADVDADGNDEIVACSTRSDNQWFVYEHTGALRSGWPKMTDSDSNGYAAGCFNENVGVADLDGDGRSEIIGPNDTHYIAAFHDDGTPLRANAIYGTVGGQNKPWARVGLHVDHAVDLRGYANCGVEHRPNLANSAPTIADVNGDGVREVVVIGNVYNCATSPYTDLYEMPFILNADRTRWKDTVHDWTAIPVPDAKAAPLSEDYDVIENNVPNPVVVDLDGDGQREIVYPSYDGRVHAYWLDKQEHGSWPFAVTDPAEGFMRFASEPIVVDLDDDGKAEVIFTSWTQNNSDHPGKLMIVAWDGTLIESVDLPYASDERRGGSLAAPTIANIDQDPDMELLVGTINRGLVAFDIANSAGARVLWGTGRGSYQRTGAAPAAAGSRGSLDHSLKAVSNTRPDPGATLTYTIGLVNSGPVLPSVRVTDTLPANAFLVAGAVAATGGVWGIDSNTLTWTGAVSSSTGVTITYAMTVSGVLSEATVLLNTAQIDDGFGKVQSRSVAAIVNGYAVHLPTIRK